MKIQIMNNPIIDNRIVNDHTFAVRLKSFLEDIQVCDAMSDEELTYLQNVAKKLVEYQIHSCIDENEIAYFKRNQII